MKIYEVAKLKKVILPQGSEHKAAGLHWVLGLEGLAVGYLNPKNSRNPTNPTNSIRLPGYQKLGD
jgi:hypothetical protein